MQQVHKDCIRKNLVMLCERLTPEPLHTHLIADGVFNDISMQYIKAPKVPFEQNQKLCLDLMKRGPTAFDGFVKCLLKSNQDEIAGRLLICEHNFKHRANIRNFQQLPEAVKMKYRNLSDQEGHGTLTPTPAVLPRAAYAHQVTTTNRSIVVQEVGDTHAGSYGTIGNHAYSMAIRRNPIDVYPMEKSPRGRMLIINNKNFPRFPGRSGERRGTDIDATKLTGMFVNYGFDVDRRDNLTGSEMCAAIDDFQSKSQWERVGCCIVAILSHGKNIDGIETVFGSDGNHETNDGAIALSWIFQQFNAKNCPRLINKPKWFIIQACRGTTHDHGQVVGDALPSPIGSPPPSGGTDMENERLTSSFQALYIEGIENVSKIPTEQDYLIAYATVPGYYSWRHTVTGSWFIHALCEVIERDIHNEDVLSMLVKVNRTVASYRDNTNSRKQVPQPVFTLTKKWFLNPIPPHSVSAP